MPFDAECYFCHVVIRNVPDSHLGVSKRCPRCKNPFTLAQVSRPRSPRLLPLHTPCPESALLAAGPQPQRDIALVKPVACEVPAPSTSLPATESTSCATPQQPETMFVSPVRRKGATGTLGLFALCFASCAFATLSLPGLMWLTLVLIALALLCGGTSLNSSSAGSRSNWAALPGLAVGLIVLLILAGSHLGALAGSRSKESSSAATGPPALVHLRTEGVAHRIEPKQETWIDAASDAAQVGTVRVRVASVTLEPPGKAIASSRLPLPERRLVIRVRVSNAGASRVAHYRGWNGASAGLLLRDEQNRELRFKPGAAREGGKFVGMADIPPEKWVDDDLVFEAPGSSRDSIRLELPGAAIGSEEKLFFNIPSSMIQHVVANPLPNVGRGKDGALQR
jgi:hypothetical protein